MAGRVGSIVLVLVACLGAVKAETYLDECPCMDKRLCAPVSVPDRREVLGFMIRTGNWRQYNWSAMTTLAIFTSFDDQELYDLVCFAHSQNVRVVQSGISFNMSQLGNASYRASWIHSAVSGVQKFFLDGFNIDIEKPVKDNSSDQQYLTELVKETYVAFKSLNKNYQVTFDVAWSPDCIDGRCYQHDKLAEYTDFLVIMSYDERGQVWTGPCIASANAANGTTFDGVQEYLQLGIPSWKLVLGLPWYGYDYRCLNLTAENVCTIEKVPYQGAPCSDAAGKQKDYRDIMENFLPFSTSGRLYNWTLDSPYFNFQDEDGSMHQMWYDDPQSLTDKYLYAASQKMRGLAFWNMDCLDYFTEDPTFKAQTKEMWDALSAFLNN